MTQIRSLLPRPRRPGELGVHSLDHLTFTVPDLKPAEAFYTGFGLDVRADGNGLALHTAGGPHRWARLQEGAAKRLGHLCFGAYQEDLEGLTVRLAAQGVARLDPPAGFDGAGVWFRDPDGTLIEMRVAEKSSPHMKSGAADPSCPAGVQGAVARSKAPFVRPRRLAHALLFSSDVTRSVAFYHQVLGLRLSDRSGDGIAFMHGIHGSDHHMLAFAKSGGPGMHHLSWDVGSINDVGLGAMQMADRGYSRGWGLGRHVLGSNYFHYVRDPWGSWSEYSADIDYIPADCDWPAADHPPEDAFYLWGPTPPADFVVNHEMVG